MVTSPSASVRLIAGLAFRGCSNIPLVAHPRVPLATVAAVLDALRAMATDPEGRKILAAGAELLKLDPPLGFVAARDSDYDNARSFLRSSVVKPEER